MKKVVITGVGSGIGKETCLRFLEENWYVVGVLRNENHMKELLEISSNLPGKLHLINVDLEKIGFQQVISTQIKELGIQSIDALLNIAGVLNPMNFEVIKLEDLNKVMMVNFTAPAMLMQELTPLLKEEGGGNIVNISSMSGFQGSVRFPGLSVYGASKAALSSFSESISVELQEYGVIVNALAIGSVNTQMLKDAFPDYQAGIEPNQMAQYIYSFANHGYRFYNGKTLAVAITNP